MTTHPTPFFLADKVPIYFVAIAQFRPFLFALQGTSSTHRTCPVRATRGHPSDSSDCEANISRGTWPTFFLVVLLVYLPTLKENVTEGSVSTKNGECFCIPSFSSQNLFPNLSFEQTRVVTIKPAWKSVHAGFFSSLSHLCAKVWADEVAGAPVWHILPRLTA